MNNTTKVIIAREPYKLEIAEEPIPEVSSEDVQIKIASAGICHTDFVAFDGLYPGVTYPISLGHEGSGVVEKCGSKVFNVKPGDRVTLMCYTYCGACKYCYRGMQSSCGKAKSMPFAMEGIFRERIVVPANIVYPITDSFSLDEAALTEPAANSYAAVDRANIYPGEKVVIIGPGPIGLLALQIASLKQPELLIMLGTRNDRLEHALKLGATDVVNVREKEPFKAIMNITNGYGADVVIICGGNISSWELSEKLMTQFGRIIIEALPETSDTKWPMTPFMFMEKAIGCLGIHGFNSSQFGNTLELMQTGKIKVSSLITHKFSMDQYQEAFNTSRNHDTGALKVIIEFSK